MTHTSTEQPSLAAIIRDLRESHARTSPGAWGKGATTHETVSRTEGREPYKVAEFRHANDAQFCDLAHVFVPRLLSEIEALQSRIQELEAKATNNAKQASLTDGQITQTLWNENLRDLRERGVDTEGMQPCGNWLAGWIP